MFGKLSTIRPKCGILKGLAILFASTSGFTQPISIKKNKYGLEVISSRQQYQQRLKAGTQQQMVLLANYLHPFYTDLKYATIDNFTHQVLYKKPEVYILKEAAEKLLVVQDSLKKRGLALLVFDAYRPYSITKKMWEIVPDDRYAANPAQGSGHNRGIAIDLTLADSATGQPLDMPTAFDNFTDTAHHSFNQLPAKVLANRQLLKSLMEQAGFKALPTEWWHYSLPNPKQYALLDLGFQDF